MQTVITELTVLTSPFVNLKFKYFLLATIICVVSTINSFCSFRLDS